MNPLADANAFAENLVRKLVIAGLVGGAIVAGGHCYLTLEPSSAELFEQANRAGRWRPPTAGRYASTTPAAAAT